ncbi:MAG TPA: bifunctional serine/threonine-protein kinase/ABC transporter substrate-binding protein, partial [Ktedonobacteraceae bacterium]|nr:bifunctional serine/threonine-protein kinase/ABC transporter substrate-binding protein [Ktedonobacteraceae bacterium]
MPDRIPRQFGNYRVIARLTKGGEAVIYQGRNAKGEIIVIRALPMSGDTAIIKRDFEAEVKKLQRLSHPYIIPLLDFGTEPGHAYLVMPYIEGGSLADRASQGHWPSFDDTLEYIKQAAQALSYVHANGIIHRDVKPHNLLLGRQSILLSDFGIAIGDTTVPAEKLWARTPRFCAPEQKTGQPSDKSDQYALAATACWLLTRGQFDTSEEELEQLRTAHPGIASVLVRALDREPARRYPTMVEFQRSLDRAAFSYSPAPPPQPPRPPQPPTRPPRSRWPLAAALACVLVLAALVVGFVVSQRPSPVVATPTTTLCLVTDLPTDGADAAIGRSIVRGVQLALTQSPLNGTYKHYHAMEIDKNDSSQQQGGRSDASVGARNIQQPGCSNPIAVIGPYNSSVAVAEIPVAAQQHILLLSPSNTAPCLTQPNYDYSPGCVYDSIHARDLSNTYARLTDTDIDQGSLDADLLASADPRVGGLGATHIDIIGDEEIYGTQLAQSIIGKLRDFYGVTPVGVYCVKPASEYQIDHACSLKPQTQAFSTDNLVALAQVIQNDHPDAIFFGGLNDRGAGLLRRQLGELGLAKVPFVGASALVADADTFFRTIGPDAANVYATFPAADPSTFTSGTAATFSREYQKTFATPPGAYSANGYDAARIVLQAIQGIVDAGASVTPANVVQAVLGHSFMSVTGKQIHFNENGDNIGQRVYT